MPDVSIVLVNWNSLELTSQCLRSLQEHTTGIEYEVIVIDNGTTHDAGPDELLKRHPWITLIRNPDNRGFSRANNQGVRRARGRYIVLLNNDTIQVENALGKTVQYMDAHPKVGAVGITHLNNDEARTHQPSFFPFPDPWQDVGSVLGLLEYKVPEPDFTREQEVDWIVGSYLFMRRECFNEVGELDERFFIFDEDVDWCYRARKLGWTVCYWPGAKMIHLGSASRPFMKDKTFVHFRSHLSYLAKHHERRVAALYYAGMVGRMSLATGKQILRAATRQAPWSEALVRIERQKQFMTLQAGKSGG